MHPSHCQPAPMLTSALSLPRTCAPAPEQGGKLGSAWESSSERGEGCQSVSATSLDVRCHCVVCPLACRCTVQYCLPLQYLRPLLPLSSLATECKSCRWMGIACSSLFHSNNGDDDDEQDREGRTSQDQTRIGIAPAPPSSWPTLSTPFGQAHPTGAPLILFFQQFGDTNIKAHIHERDDTQHVSCSSQRQWLRLRLWR